MNKDSLIEIYSVHNNSSYMDIKPTNVKRKWMDDTDGHAYRCLPLNIANQYGWIGHNIKTFTATWDGGSGPESIVVTEATGKPTQIAMSHFGHGILTIPTDFIIKTPKNISIYVRGVSNHNYENVYPLDAIVETDWLPFTFTMNYKFIKPGSVTFEKGDPIFMFFPIDREYIESFDIVQKEIKSNEELLQQYNKYAKSRKDYTQNDTTGKGQKFYVSGSIVDEKINISNHQRKIELKNPIIDF